LRLAKKPSLVLGEEAEGSKNAAGGRERKFVSDGRIGVTLPIRTFENTIHPQSASFRRS
jgi:hypothetical protein